MAHFDLAIHNLKPSKHINWTKIISKLYLEQLKLIIKRWDDAPLSSLMDSIVSPKMKITVGKRIGAYSLACNTLGVKGHVGAPGWD